MLFTIFAIATQQKELAKNRTQKGFLIVTVVNNGKPYLDSDTERYSATILSKR